MIDSKQRYFAEQDIKAPAPPLPKHALFNTLSDLIVALCFLLGSFFFLTDVHTLIGAWLFVIGSVQLLIKPLVTLLNWWR
ncbi:YrhK family protein [Shewanella algae]|uniref:YrhK family protein n=1 Tax=Shewanella algae TaxID=38313 RepID=UPI001F1CEE21|nr:YrhK family protein [Shewanella algae]MCE9781827.1 YrhK family protein [Shewanella algae]